MFFNDIKICNKINISKNVNTFCDNGYIQLKVSSCILI